MIQRGGGCTALGRTERTGHAQPLWHEHDAVSARLTSTELTHHFKNVRLAPHLMITELRDMMRPKIQNTELEGMMRPGER